ncbi:MAG: PPC domain-containing protein, partial [Deltaproteobacteria bacterium]
MNPPLTCLAKFLASAILLTGLAGSAAADTPATMYIFPAGGQRGTNVTFRVGGLYLHEACPFEMAGPGVEAAPKIEQTKTIWFEGPVIPLPDSQAAEDYPQDLAGSVKIAPDAAPGPRSWRVWTAQGAVPSRPFVIGTLPEVVEEEIDGEPIPVPVTLPITANGRIFPREDVDVWSFAAKAAQTITCSVLTSRLGSPFDARLEIRDARGTRLAESAEAAPPGSDALVRFTAPADGTYAVFIHDAKFGGLQHYVYRLTITAGSWVDHVYPLGGRRGTTGKFELSGGNVPAAPVEIAIPADAPSRFFTTVGAPDAASNLFPLAVDDLPELLEQEPNDAPAQLRPVEVPAVLNGRIDKPGDVDGWAFRAAKDQTLEF